jgi:hypothetical protein
MSKQRVVPKLGDIVEIPLPDKRVAYVQYVGHHREPPRFGAMIRVLPGVFDKRPGDFEELAGLQETFVTFFPLGAACRRRYVTIVGTVPPPARFDTWPLFKNYNENFQTGERTWYVWDGHKSRRVDKLTHEYYDLPMEEIINLTCLENRIVRGWSPRDEVRERDKEEGQGA